MAVSINPVDLFRIFRERGIRDRDAVADYIETIGTVATSLARAWTDIYQIWPRGDKGLDEWSLPDLRLYFSSISQSGLFDEVHEHYKRASSVLSGRLSEAQMKELFDALGTLLRTRNQTKRIYEMADESWPGSVTINEVERNIEIMQKEAAVLRTLAAVVRAQR